MKYLYIVKIQNEKFINKIYIFYIFHSKNMFICIYVCIVLYYLKLMLTSEKQKEDN